MDILRDDVKQLFIKFLVPAIGSALVVTAYSFVDTIAIGQGVGPDGTAACAVILPIFCLAEFLGLMSGIGGSILFIRARGSGKEAESNMYFTSALIAGGILMALAWILLLVFQEPFYRLYGADDTIIPYALEYGGLIIGAFPLFVLSPLLAGFIRNDGAPKRVLAASLAGAATNIFGDWFFVFPMGMGMFGAALATVLGALLQSSVLVTYFFSKKCTAKPVRPKNVAANIRRILSNGFGTGLAQLSVIAVTFAANNQIMRYSDASALAVYGVMGTIASLFTHIFSGIGQSAQPIASGSYGAGMIKRCWQACSIGIKYAVLMGVIFTGACMLFPAQITSVFVKATPEIIETATFGMRVYAVSFIFLGINTFLSIYLQSIMRARSAAVIALMRGFILICGLLAVLPAIFAANGVWYAFAASDTVVAVFAVIYTVRLRKRAGY